MTAERYTAVFTGFLSEKKPGEYLYLTMSDEPLAPGGSTLSRGRPPYERMGCEIEFSDLPEDCRRLVLESYQELWGLKRLPGRPELAFEGGEAPLTIEGAGPERSGA